jgi:hypothetical protein
MRSDGPRAGKQTYDPKQPTLHLVDRNDISDIHYEIWKNGHGHPIRCMIVAEEQSDRAEKTLHREESGIIDEVERKKSARRASEVSHKINYDVVDKNARGRERHIRECVGDLVGGRTIEAIVRLLPDNRTTKHLRGHLTKTSALCEWTHIE